MAVDSGGVVIRMTEWGAMNVALEAFLAGTDTEPIFKGLPDDRCQTAHWGYVLEGRVRGSKANAKRYPAASSTMRRWSKASSTDAGSRTATSAASEAAAKSPLRTRARKATLTLWPRGSRSGSE